MLRFSPAREKPVFDQYFPQQPLPCDKCSYREEEQINLLVQMAATAWEKKMAQFCREAGKGHARIPARLTSPGINENQPQEHTPTHLHRGKAATESGTCMTRKKLNQKKIYELGAADR